MKATPRIFNRAGFTLIEMAIVLVIVGIIIAIVASVLPSLIASSKIKQAQALLESADYALRGYSIANHRLPFADNNNDGLEDSGIFAGTLPYRTLGLSSSTDIWGNPIGYAVYGLAGGSNNLTDTDATTFCTVISNASIAAFDSSIVHTTAADPCSGADDTNSSNQAYVLASAGLKDLDGANGRWDDCNSQSGPSYNEPSKIQTSTYDDLVRAYSLNELNQKLCSGSGGGGGGGGGSGGGENTYTNGCSNGIDDDGDGPADCLDSDCFADPACTAGSLAITTPTIPSGPVNGSYMTTFAASGGMTPYQWTLSGNGGFSDFTVNSFTGTLTGTLDQCPNNYTIGIQVQDATPAGSGGPLLDSGSFTLQVISDLSVTRTSGAGTTISWASSTQTETFAANGGRLGNINWTLNTGGATGFTVNSTGANTATIRKTGSTTPGAYTFTLTATGASCPTNSANLILDITVTALGGGAPGGIGGVVDSLEFDTTQGINPDIIHVAGDIYAVAATGQSNDGFLYTLQISPDGQIGANTIDRLEFDFRRAENPDIIQVAGDIFAIAYTAGRNQGRLVTVQIASDGQIGNRIIDSFTYDNFNCYEPDLIQVSSEMFAIAYTGQGDDGFVKTVRIAGNGQIANSTTDTLEFDTSQAREADWAHISGDIFAIAYSGPGNNGYFTTIQIDASGQIGNAVVDRMEFDPGLCRDPDTVQVFADIYAVAYHGPGDDGFIKTIQIAADGQITSSVIDTLEFDPVTGMQPVIASTGSDVFAIAYRGPNNDGFFITLQIDPTGQIGATVLDSLEFDPNTCQEPSMVTLGNAVFAVVYRGNGSDGYIATINLQ